MKNTLIKKIKCPSPEHEDTDPSCGLYSDGSAYCFGCSTYFPLVGEPTKAEPVIVDNIEERVGYIDALPKESIRGLTLPFDNLGYYIVWPNRSYYKRRNWVFDSDRSRYFNPRGHSQPLFILEGNPGRLIVVEGEINALTLRECDLDCTVVSPGSAGSFKQSLFRNYLLNVKQYHTILILVDNDTPGVEACLTAMTYLKDYPGLVVRKLMNNDCNDIMVTHGKEALKKEITDLAML